MEQGASVAYRDENQYHLAPGFAEFLYKAFIVVAFLLKLARASEV